MRRDKKRNKIIIFILTLIVCMMGVGYAAFQTQLDIKGSTEISSEWDIKIISAEVSDIGGSGENVKNTYTDLTANLEANLYSKGDYVEYNVIVENAGTFDAKLDTLGITNSNNEAVKITSTGLVKGQTLYKNSTVTLTVRIEYNANYEGDASGTSGETTVDLGFVQNSEGTIVPTTDHLVTYDYTTNGGESTNAENEYVAEGTSINLSYTAVKKNYEFKGWNTNAQAAEGLSDLTMGTEDITLYAIFEAIDTTPPIIESINTTSTTNSITAVVIASDEESGISKYEFSIDGGKTWIDNGVSNTYTFTGLKQGTSYNIDVRVTNGVNLTAEKTTSEGLDLINGIVNEGEGLYHDEYEDGRYVYKGANPNNYVWFNEELWRIISIESDGTMKIVRDDLLPNITYDSAGIRTTGYCSYESAKTKGCNAWMASGSFTNGTYSGAVDKDAELNTYLNNTYYDNLTSIAQSQIDTHTFGVGPVVYVNTDLAMQIENENDPSWEGKVGLIGVSDYLRANSNINECKTYKLNHDNRENCINTNYLNATSSYWTISQVDVFTEGVRVINNDGTITGVDAAASFSLRPAVYLKDSVEIKSGNGTSEDPYQLGNSVKTSDIPAATFSQHNDAGKIIVAVHFPEGCGDKYTCTYTDEAGEEHEWDVELVEVAFADEGVITATVSDGINEVTSSYTVIWQREMDFEYTGATQTYTAPADGYYKIELWGAKGGDTAGAKGGYATGEVYLTKGTELYVYVGQRISSTSNATAFNGGPSSSGGKPGGGATDVRLVSGSWNNATSLRSRIMVAGGGGAGSGGSGTPGAGGTLVGGNGGTATGGKQTAGGSGQGSYTSGSFGTGGNGCGGGGGYYGGGGGGCVSGAGGGSSYISGYAGSNSVTSASSSTHTNGTKHYSGLYFINNDMTAGVNSGNGRAHISYIGEASSPDSSKIKGVRYIRDCTNGNSTNGSNHWIELQAISYGENVAKDKTVTGTSPVLTNWGSGTLESFVDGKMDDTNQYTNLTSGEHCLTVDLGKEYDLEEVAVWHYYEDERTYYDNVTSVAGENEIYRDIHSNDDYAATSKGHHITSDITVPQFKAEEEATQTNVNVLFPGGCGEDYNCSYIVNGSEEVTVQESTKLQFTDSGTIVAKITYPSGKVTASTYTVNRNNLYVASYGSDSSGDGTPENPYATINKAYDEAYQTATIYVMDDITVNEEISFDENKNISLTSYSPSNENNSVIRGSSLTEAFINITSGKTIMENITLDGNNVQATYPILRATANTYTLLSDDTIIQNAYRLNAWGGAVAVNGATASDKNTVLVIDGATITNNIGNGAAGLNISNATFEMIDGEISNNSTRNTTSNDTGGLGLDNVLAVIKGGTITGNKGRHGFAIMIQGGMLHMTGGTISNNSGVKGAVTVWNGGTFVLNGGTIKNNTASSQNGGIWRNTADSPVGTYTYRSGVVCGNKPSNSYETSSTCPS